MARLSIIAIFFLTILVSYAQSPEKLDNQLSTLKTEIEQLDKQISSNVNQQQSQLQKSKALDAKISTRERLIAEIDARVSLLKNEMGSDGRALAANQSQLSALRQALASLLRSAYKRSYSGASFSPASISESQKVEAWQRQVAFLASKIKDKIALNDSLGILLGSRLEAVKKAYSDVAKLQAERASELTKLQKEKQQAAQLHKQLQQQEGALRSQADSKRSQMAELQRKISQAISREAGKKVADVDKVTAAKVSKIFGENIGRLPVPVSPAKVVDRYGVHDHPTEKGLKVNNNGVNIRSGVGASVRCVAEGEVRAVLNVEGLGSSVIVRHGNYLTVYANMKDLLVRSGDKIQQGAVLGVLQEDELHFEIWEEAKNLNPERWLLKM